MQDQDFGETPSDGDDDYDTTLRQYLGGIGSGMPPKTITGTGTDTDTTDSETEPVIRTLWLTLGTLLEAGGCPKDTLSSVVLQTFSNAHGRQPGRQMWAAREIAQNPSGSGGGDRPSGDRVRSLIHAVWYLKSCRAYHTNPNNPVGLYNLLMNPQFFHVFRTPGASWYPQPVLITTSSRDGTPAHLPEWGLNGLIEQLGGKPHLDAYRWELRKVTDSAGLSDDALWAQVTDEHLAPYKEVINRFVTESVGLPGVISAVNTLREDLVSIFCNEKEGAWSKLPTGPFRDQALAQLRSITTESLLRTILFLLLHEPEWTHYYYFVFGSVPNTSGPSLAIFTKGALRPQFQVCAQYLLTEAGKHLAILETQKLAKGRAEERMSYFGHLHTHTFTKGFTTPVHNETMRLQAAVPPKSFEQGAAGRAQERLRRFEYAMQSSEFLGVGEVREDEPDTFRYDAELIDATMCQRLIADLHRAAGRCVELRLNDLFDDPAFAGYSGIDPTRDLGLFEDCLETPEPDVMTESFFADFPLLAYHLQSVVQNATEAIDLVAAWNKIPQKVQIAFSVKSDKGRRYAVFSVSNTCAGKVGIPDAVCQNVNCWQTAVQEHRASPADWSPLSTKSGGHSGMGLLLTATFCQSIRVVGLTGEVKAHGKLVLDPGTGEATPAGSEARTSPTVVSMWFPLPEDSPGTDERVWIDRRILFLVPGFQTVPRHAFSQQQHSHTAAIPERPFLGLEPTAARLIQVLIVEDDSADRQRFRLHLQKKYPTPPEFHGKVAFAWDARNRSVFPPEAICEFLSQKETPTKVFLDLAWDNEDEEAFRQLRTARSYQRYRTTLDGWADGQKGPKGLRLLRLLEDCRKAKHGEMPDVQILVVTAYKSQYLTWYLGERYGRRVEGGQLPLVFKKPVMKWSDGERLRDFIG
jgi:hypothetical protein